MFQEAHYSSISRPNPITKKFKTMNRLYNKHLEAIKSKSNKEDFDAVTTGYVLYNDEFEEVSKESANITKEIACNFAEFFSKNFNYYKSGISFTTIKGEEYCKKIGKDFVTEEELFNKYIESLK